MAAPSVCETHVFSSRTGRWEEKHFAREGGEPAGTEESWVSEKRYSVYSRGALYVHSQNDFFCRVSLASNTYRVIKPPVQQITGRPDSSTEQQSWACLGNKRGDDEAWILEDKNYNNADFGEYYDTDDEEEGDYYYDQQPYDDEDDEEPDELGGYICFLGFHPFEEVVFFNCNALRRGVAYDLNTSKVRDLGNMLPKSSEGQHTAYIRSSFPYTPCWMEDSLPTTH
ncbi:hypothetical protein EJB05_30733, partial [Eragrostis curvula]